MRPLIALLLAAPLLLLGCDTAISDDDGDRARDDCQRQCGMMNFGFRDCASAQVLSECEEACLRVTVAKAESFASCVDSRSAGTEGCPELECLSTLDVSTGSSSNSTSANNVSANNAATGTASCKEACDDLTQFCAAEVGDLVGDCKTACDVEPADTRASFEECVQSNKVFCEELPVCLDLIGVF